MTEWRRTAIGEFLKERDERYCPDDKKLHGLERLNKIDFTGQIHLSGKGSKTDMIIVHPGDLVISGINVAKGALAVYQGLKPITATIHYSSYQFDKGQIDIEYFKRFVKSQAFIKMLEVRGGIKTEIKPKHFLPIEIDLPDIEKQHEIVAFFRRIESEIGELGNEISMQSNYLAKLRQVVLQEAIEGKLTAEWRKRNPKLISGESHASELLEKIRVEKERLAKNGKIRKEKPLESIPHDGGPFVLPEGWVWCNLVDVASGFEYGSSAKSSKEGEVPVLRMGNIQDGAISWDDLVFSSDTSEISQYNLNDGDILFNRTNSRELVGKTALYDGKRKAIFAGYLVRFHMIGDIQAKYANLIMNSLYHRDWCNEIKTDALGQSNINATKLRSHPFPLAPLAEQKIIVERVARVESFIKGLESQVSMRQDQAGLLMQSVLRESFNRDQIDEAKTDEMMGRFYEDCEKANKVKLRSR